MSKERETLVGVALVLLVIIGINVVIGFIPWPDIDVNPPDLPDLPLPSISLPGWVKAILESKKYWWPVVIGLLIALGEMERQKRKKKEEQA